MSRILIVALLGGIAVSCGQANPPSPSLPPSPPAAATVPMLNFSHDRCRAIVTAAIRAARAYVDKTGTGVIPPEDWGNVIAALHPIRVEEEVEPNVIVFMVLSESSSSEAGLCVCQTDTSGSVTQPPGVSLEVLCNDADQDGVLYRYQRAK